MQHDLDHGLELDTASAKSSEPNDFSQLAATVHSRHLTTTLLLLLASHRPMTFVAGQMLYALAPLCALLGWEQLEDWAALLSAPDANQQLTKLLAP